MKKFIGLLSIMLIMGLFFAAAGTLTASAESTNAPLAKSTKTKHGGGGNGHGNGNGNGHGNGHGQGHNDVGDNDDVDDAQAEGTPTPGGPSTNSHKPNHKVNLKGTIIGIDGNNVTLALKHGMTVTVVLSDSQRIHIPTLNWSGNLDDLQVGMSLKVKVMTGADGEELTVLTVHAKPGNPKKWANTGIVTAYVAGVSITIQSAYGAPSTYLLSSSTPIVLLEDADALAVGSKVTIVAPRTEVGEDLEASRIVVHPDPDEDDD